VLITLPLEITEMRGRSVLVTLDVGMIALKVVVGIVLKITEAVELAASEIVYVVAIVPLVITEITGLAVLTRLELGVMAYVTVHGQFVIVRVVASVTV